MATKNTTSTNKKSALINVSGVKGKTDRDSISSYTLIVVSKSLYHFWASQCIQEKWQIIPSILRAIRYASDFRIDI